MLGTFHSIGVKILRRHAELAGLRSDFTILDTDDVIRLIKQLIQAEGLDDKRWPARQFANMIDGWKNKALLPADIPEGDARACQRKRPRALRRLSGAPENPECLRLRRPPVAPDRRLPPEPGYPARISGKFRYMLVDEYQDTNVAQYMWLRLLAQRPKRAAECLLRR